MNPMNALHYSKVDVSLKEFALKPVSPYSGKFIGFKINQGTLHTDLKYSVSEDTVDGDNIIVIAAVALTQQVTSGENNPSLRNDVALFSLLLRAFVAHPHHRQKVSK